MSIALPVHGGDTPLFLLLAEARAIIASTEPREFTRAQQKQLARQALTAKGLPLSHRCTETGCTTVIVDVDLLTGSLRDKCWDHSGPHYRHRKGQKAMKCVCGSVYHGWCSKASAGMGPNKPGARSAYVQVLA